MGRNRIEQSITETANSHIHSLIDNFEAYYPRQQAKNLQSKLRILNIFGQQHPPEHLPVNLKDDLCHQLLFNRIKHVEFWVRALDGPRKDLETVPLRRGTLVSLALKRSSKPPKLKYETL